MESDSPDPVVELLHKSAFPICLEAARGIVFTENNPPSAKKIISSQERLTHFYPLLSLEEKKELIEALQRYIDDLFKPPPLTDKGKKIIPTPLF